MKLYITEGAVMVLVFVYLPIALLALCGVWRACPPRLTVRLIAMTVTVVISIALPFWDVTATSLKMAELCPSAGITIKRAVYVDGFYTNLGDVSYLREGFTYYESKIGNRIEIYTKIGDAIRKQEVDAEKTPYVPRSRYEFIYDDEHGPYKGRRDIRTSKSVVRDRETNEELGFAISYFAYPGWVDRNTIALFGQILWMCPPRGQHPDIQLRRETLLPRKSHQRGQHQLIF